jgi:deoxyribodipyrimidine photo-lyase
LYFNRQYEVNESQRDQRVTAALQKQQIAVHSYDDQVILPPGSVLSQQGQPLRIFTPYKRAWYRVFSERTIKQLPAPKAQTPLALSLQPAAIPAKLTAFQSTVDPARWPAGQGAASKRLRQFVSHHLFQYDKERDFPALDGTSQLSPYLAAGMISPRQCFLAALEANQMELDTGNAGAVVWMSELIWREFYKHLLVAAPRVSKHKAYLEVTDNIVWDNNEKQLQAWQQGQTGYPLIDAAMRQLNTLGWMHNRLRMVVAMFLTKNLFFDWRLGEKYFMSQLIDGDLAANNGGWQWSASTGTDAAPYFRIFNPIRQSERFDPEGKFILQYCPELAGFNGKSIHEPYESLPLLAAAANYPRPIIGLNDKRSRVLAAYKKTNTTVK